MRVETFVISAVICLAPVICFGANQDNRSSVLAQATTIPSPNALDDQDRLRDRERERTHDEVRERLGDRSKEPTTSGQGFGAPTTNDKRDVPDPGPKSNQNR